MIPRVQKISIRTVWYIIISIQVLVNPDPKIRPKRRNRSLFSDESSVLVSDVNSLLMMDFQTYLTHPNVDKMAVISQKVFSDAFSWMKSFVS